MSLAILSMHTSPFAQLGLGDGGGMNVYVKKLSSALARSGIECDVFTRATSSDQPSEIAVEPNLRLHNIKAGPLEPVPKANLDKFLDDFTSEVAKKLTSGRFPWNSPLDAIHANYWLSGVVGHRLKHELEVPLISTFHTLEKVKAELAQDQDENTFQRARAEGEVIACSDVVLASCSSEARQLISMYSAHPNRIQILPPGVQNKVFFPTDKIHARSSLGIDPLAKVLLFVGRIQALKGPDVAIETLGLLENKEAILIIVGGPSGPFGQRDFDYCKDLVRSLGLEKRVRFIPPQPHETLSSYYRAADICLVPSRSESFGLVALEAAACGTPVVAASVGGLTNLVDPGHSGFLVNSRNPAEYAFVCDQILNDARLSSRLSQNAVEQASHYTWSGAAFKFRKVLRLVQEEEILVECC